MPLINQSEPTFKSNAQANSQGAENFQNQQTNFNQNAQASNATQKGLLTLPPALMQIVP
jgi:hypothetical protein